MKHALAARWAQHWSRMAPRERLGLGLAVGMVAAALLWWVGLVPALATLRQAPAQHARLDGGLQELQAMAQQAQQLQAMPRVSPDEALRALEAATQRHLGPEAKLVVVSGQATATFKAARASALAQWLADVRINARAVPSELRLSAATPAQAAPSAQPSVPPEVTGVWQGSAVFNLAR